MLEDAAGIRRVVLACGTVDLRKGIDGLATIIGDKYGQNPFEKGTLFLFCGKRSDRCKGLLWMGTGFLLLYKRFEAGRLSWPRNIQEAADLTEEQYKPDQNNSFVCYQAGTMQLHLENPIFPKADIRILMTFVAGKNDELGLKADSHLSQISAILPLVRKADIMCKKFTPDELNKMDHKTKDDVIYQMQDRLDRLEHNYENLVEQIRLANQQRFGRHTEKLDDIAGQLSFFNEAEANYDGTAKEPTVEEVIDSSRKVPRKPKKKGQREEDLKDFPQEVILHDIPEQELNEAFGEGNWKSMPDEIFWQLRFEPAKWTAEKHIIKVYVGTDGAHQDEFLRGDHPETMFREALLLLLLKPQSSTPSM